ncbi:MAG: hypothetical protein KDK03_13060 [Rhodobacteraceae bacterium]|nr:hypothetical protein [Paracoccaceae bacterium]
MARPASTLPEDFPKPVFRPLDGHVEIAVAEAAEARMARPRRVTAILAAMCARLGSAEGGADSARRVSAAGREWLLQRAGLEFFRGTRWFEAPCPGCGARFDLELDLTAVPQGRAGAGFPVIEVETSLGARRFEAPNGHHEEAFAARRDGDARRIFAGLCGLADEAAAEVARFEAADLERIDAALEAVSPEIADGVNAACPDCGGPVRVRIDPLTFAFPRPEAVLREVHAIAMAYRWSERAILDLPSRRRRAYVALIAGDADSRAARPRGGMRLS